MPASIADDRPIFLTGVMGCGKSSVGRALAARLGWDFVDTDDLVERREGRSISKIFEESGENHFRQAEWDALRTLEGKKRCVVACGGGLVTGREPRRWISRHGRTVWLDCPLEVCARRVTEGGGRPLWAPGDPVSFRSFHERRRALYALSEICIDASVGDADAVADSLLERLGAVFH